MNVLKTLFVFLILCRCQSHSEVQKCRPLLSTLRLRGGAGGEAQRAYGRTISDAVTTMDLGDTEEELRMKSRRESTRQQIVLDSPKGTEMDEVGGEKLDETPLRFHAHGNRVVLERKKKEKQPKEYQRTSVATAKIEKRRRKVLKRSSINCTLAVAHGLFNVTEFATYLKQRIKVDGKTGNLDGSLSVEVNKETHTVIVSAFKANQMKKKRVWSKRLFLADTFSTRYLRYLTKKWICKVELKDIIRCISTDFSKASLAKGGSGSKFEIRYTNMHKNRHLRHRMSREHGTRLEQVRRDYVDSFWAEHDANMTRLPRKEMLLERKIKSTGERVGGLDYVRSTCKTIAETARERGELLQHWTAHQHKAYRMPFGGAMRGVLDQSICRHDPDRVGKGTSTHSTAGYSSPRALRSRTGLRVGMESMLYTGTAPNGFKSVQRKAVAQRLVEGYQKTLRQVSGGYSVQGEADRRIYNWKPKWLLSGKMDLHKRDWR